MYKDQTYSSRDATARERSKKMRTYGGAGARGQREGAMGKMVYDATGYGYSTDWVKLHASWNPHNQESDFITMKDCKKTDRLTG